MIFVQCLHKPEGKRCNMTIKSGSSLEKRGVTTGIVYKFSI